MMSPEIEKEMFLQVLRDQLKNHLGFHIQDLYKLVYQVTCGGTHLLRNKTRVRRELLEEWKISERIPKGENLLEIIDPRGEVMRVNLRVYKKIGGKMDSLLMLFIQSAEAVQKDKKRLISYWEMAMEMAEKNEIPFSKSILEDFLIEQGKNGFPLIHHSDPYLKFNRPSYRIVLKQFWEELMIRKLEDGV